MKIISWNCNGALWKKFNLFEKLDADILVIQECEDPRRSKNSDYKKWAKNYLWHGNGKNKGIGVFAKFDIGIDPIDLDSGKLESFLPFTVNNNLKILAVWTRNPDSGKSSYIGQLWQYLQLHKNYFKGDNNLIIGDFNSPKIWDKQRNIGNHSNVVNELKEIGILSIYHHFIGCDQGTEIHPTFYMYRKIEKPYHIDYAFISESLISNSKIDVGNKELWLEYSDHMPLFLTID